MLGYLWVCPCKIHDFLKNQNKEKISIIMENYLMTFSPTGGTEQTAKILTSAIADQWDHIDLLRPISEISLTADDICLIAVPSFGGRIPTTSAERLANIHANGARAILVCVYGNRAYEDTLSELQDVLTASSFDCVAAVAAIAEHSIIREFGAGRPDADDCAQLIAFAEKIKECLENPSDNPLVVPGEYGTYTPFKNTPFVPAETDGCVNCGTCAEACPTEAIGDTPDKIDPERCIKCMRCVAVCPISARKLDEKIYAALRERLAAVCGTRKENELFL